MRKETPKKILAIDIAGTLVHHKTGRAVPLADVFLKSAMKQGYDVRFLTNWPREIACGMLRKAFGRRLKIDPLLVTPTTRQDDKTDIIVSWATTEQIPIWFVDDKTQNILGAGGMVSHLPDIKLTVIGHLGSGKYARGAGGYCAAADIPYAFSFPDLAEIMRVPLDVGHNAIKAMKTDDLIHLIPGLHHPCSATAGETSIFDHRMPVSVLLGRDLTENQWVWVWVNLGWIRCRECLMKAALEFAIKESGLQLRPKGVYKAREWLAYMRKAPDNERSGIKKILKKRVNLLAAGLDNVINEEAANARPENMKFDRDRFSLLCKLTDDLEIPTDLRD